MKSGIPTNKEERQRQQDQSVINEYTRNRRIHEKTVADAQKKLDETEGDYELSWAWQRLSEALTDLAKMEARYRYARRREAYRAEQAEKQERNKARGG